MSDEHTVICEGVCSLWKQGSKGRVTRESKNRVSPSLLLWRGILTRVTTFES
jgi:hypothetical protein